MKKVYQYFACVLICFWQSMTSYMMRGFNQLHIIIHGLFVTISKISYLKMNLIAWINYLNLWDNLRIRFSWLNPLAGYCYGYLETKSLTILEIRNKIVWAVSNMKSTLSNKTRCTLSGTVSHIKKSNDGLAGTVSQCQKE